MKTRRRWIVAIVAAAALGAFLLYATHDRRDLQPATAEMEALVGASVSEPTYQSSSPLSQWRFRARLWWIYVTLPIPNQMAVRYVGDVWTYTFPAGAGYRPPAASPLRPSGPDGKWSAEAPGGWRYHVRVDPERGGTLVAHLLP